MKRWIPNLIFSSVFLTTQPAQALEINLIKVGSPEANQLSDIYGDGYGYSPREVAPAFLAPVEEAPSLLRIAQAGSVSPLSILMMRRLGMSYNTILKNLALTPLALSSTPNLPSVTRWTDDILIDMGRNYFLSNVLQVTPRLLPYFPKYGTEFVHSVITPYHPVHGAFLPPGIAKKYGFWAPPGQMKKMDYPAGAMVLDHPGRGNKGIYFNNQNWKSKHKEKLGHRKFKSSGWKIEGGHKRGGKH